MFALIVSIAGAAGALVLLVIQLLSSRKQRLPRILKSQSAIIWKMVPAFITFLCFLTIIFSLYQGGGASSLLFGEKHELALRADSLSNLLSKERIQQNSEKNIRLRREEELTSALKSKITTAYTLAAPAIRIDTIVVVVRDTANERRLKGRLENMHLKNFELLKTIDSLKAQNTASEREEK
jgi:hypothetical protein